jgi:hypothetical protein
MKTSIHHERSTSQIKAIKLMQKKYKKYFQKVLTALDDYDMLYLT